MGDWLAVFAEPCKVQLDGLPHLGQDCVLGVCQGDTSRQIRAPCAVSAVAGSFYHDRVAGHGVLRSSPACLRMLRSVPGVNSALGLPAIVTRPGLSGCLNCRWLPAVVTRYQPSASISLIISRTFRGTDHSIQRCCLLSRGAGTARVGSLLARYGIPATVGSCPSPVVLQTCPSLPDQLAVVWQGGLGQPCSRRTGEIPDGSLPGCGASGTSGQDAPETPEEDRYGPQGRPHALDQSL